MNLELIRILVAILMFAIASFFDLRYRSISDWIWVIFGIAGGSLYFFDSNTYADFRVVISIAFSTSIALAIYKFGLFGGADALMLVTLAIILPIYTGEFLLSDDIKSVFSPVVTPIMVLANGLIISTIQIGNNLVRNLAFSRRNSGRLFEGLEHETTLRKAFAVMIGHRTEKSKRYYFSIEKQVNGRKEFDFGIKAMETTEYEHGKDVWITNGIPFMTYLFAGFLILIFGGDVFSAMKLLLKHA